MNPSVARNFLWIPIGFAVGWVLAAYGWAAAAEALIAVTCAVVFGVMWERFPE